MSMPPSYMGVRVLFDSALVDIVEDWSQCRSPGRARRRHRQGFKTRRRLIGVPKKEIFRMPNALVMHPDIYPEFQRAIEHNNRRSP